MSIETWLLFLAVGSVAAISPGPGLLFTLTTALRYGGRTAFVAALANAFGIVFVCLAVALGVSIVISASAWGFLALKLVGGAYLIYLGLKIWRDRSVFEIDAERIAAPPPTGRVARQAIMIALSNPKALALLTALLPPFMSPHLPAAPQALALSLAYAGLCVLSHGVVLLAAGAMRRLLTTKRRADTLRRIVGTSFLGFGLAMAASARP